MLVKSDPLTPVEAKQLQVSEKIIAAGEKTFVSVGVELARIKALKLYRGEHESFESYCDGKWGFGRQYAYELITAAKVVQALPESVSQCLTNARQAKALAQVPPAKRAAVIQAVKASGKLVTAKAIKAASPPPKAPTGKQPRRSGPVDASGLLIPEGLLPLWNRTEEVSLLLLQVSRVRTAINKAEKEQDILFAQLSYNSALSHLDQAYSDLKASVPAYVCPVCGGHEQISKSCTLCKGLGLLSEFYWRAVSVELKDLRKQTVEGQNA